MSHNESHQHHIVPLSTYFAVFAALIVGTIATAAVAYQDLGWMNNVIMLAIAVTKATLVVVFFMHVKYGSRLTWLIVAGSVFFLLILIIFTMNDYLYRSWGTWG